MYRVEYARSVLIAAAFACLTLHFAEHLEKVVVEIHVENALVFMRWHGDLEFRTAVDAGKQFKDAPCAGKSDWVGPWREHHDEASHAADGVHERALPPQWRAGVRLVLAGGECIKPQGSVAAAGLSSQESLKCANDVEELVLPCMADKPRSVFDAHVAARSQLLAQGQLRVKCFRHDKAPFDLRRSQTLKR